MLLSRNNRTSLGYNQLKQWLTIVCDYRVTKYQTQFRKAPQQNKRTALLQAKSSLYPILTSVILQNSESHTQN